MNSTPMSLQYVGKKVTTLYWCFPHSRKLYFETIQPTDNAYDLYSYVSGSNLGSDNYAKIIAVSLSPSRKVPGAHLNMVTTTSFHTLSNSLFTNNSAFDATKSDRKSERHYKYIK